MFKVLVKELKSSHLTIGSVESVTGGLFASSITSIPGVSSIFKGSLVTYSIPTKAKLLGFGEDYINKYGVVSKEVALKMAELGKKKLDVDICVSFTGNAGPDALCDLPVGLIYVGVSYEKKTEVYEFHLEGDRNKIRNEIVNKVAAILIDYLKK